MKERKKEASSPHQALVPLLKASHHLIFFSPEVFNTHCFFRALSILEIVSHLQRWTYITLLNSCQSVS